MNYVESLKMLGLEAKQIPSITGDGAPTTSTEGAVGCLYMDNATKYMYKCIAADEGVYTWENILDDSNTNTIVQTTGDSETAVMSQKATTDAIAGKTDRITEEWKVYTTGSGGALVGRTYTDVGTVGALAQYGDDSDRGDTNKGGFLNTASPTKLYHCANKMYVDEGLAGKFNKPSTLKAWSLLGIGNYDAETGEYAPQVYTRDPLGTGNAYVATFSSASNEAIWVNKDAYCNYTLGGADPIYPRQYATKRYVDDADNALKMRLNKAEKDLTNVKAAAEGKLYRDEIVESVDTHNDIPSDALPYAMIEEMGCMMYTRNTFDAARFLIEETTNSDSNHYIYHTDLNVSAGNLHNEVALDGTTANNCLFIPIEPITISGAYNVPISVTILGQWTSSWSAPLICAVQMQNGEYFGDTFEFDENTDAYHSVIETSQYTGSVITGLLLNLACDSITFDQCCISLEIVTCDSNSSHIESITNSSLETIWSAPQELCAIDEYGLGMSSECYNYVDFQRMVLVVNCTRQPGGELSKCDVPYEIDLSEILSYDDAIINVGGQEHIIFNARDGGEENVFPHKIKYQVKVV